MNCNFTSACNLIWTVEEIKNTNASRYMEIQKIGKKSAFRFGAIDTGMKQWT